MNDRLKLRITGKNPDYFLKEIIKRHLPIYFIKKHPTYLDIIVDRTSYETIKTMKTTYKIKIIARYGLSKIKYVFKKYSLFLYFFLLGIGLNIFLSNIIFNVEVVHSNQELINTVKKDLEKLGIKKYHFKVSYAKKEKIKKELLAKEKDLLEWVEIEEKGTKYIVKVEQRKKNSKEKNCKPRHIIAKKNALIKNIQADAGEVVKKKNDYVSKGEIIISGLIHNKEKIVSKRCSIGKVYGEVWYKAKVIIPKDYKNVKLTKQKCYGLTHQFIDKEYNFLNKFPTYEKKEYNILESKIVPINIGFAKFIKTIEEQKKVTISNVDEEAKKIATEKVKKHLKAEDKILSKKVLKKTEINSKIEVEVFFKVQENITNYLDISNLDIEEMNEKEE